MKSTAYRGIGGQAKLRGKKQMMLSCRCCDLFNFCEKMLWDEAQWEIKDYEREAANAGRFGDHQEEH